MQRFLNIQRVNEEKKEMWLMQFGKWLKKKKKNRYPIYPACFNVVLEVTCPFLVSINWTFPDKDLAWVLTTARHLHWFTHQILFYFDFYF